MGIFGRTLNSGLVLKHSSQSEKSEQSFGKTIAGRVPELLTSSEIRQNVELSIQHTTLNTVGKLSVILLEENEKDAKPELDK